MSDILNKFLQGAVQAINNGQLLEVQREALNRIDKRLYLGNQQALFQQTQYRPHRFTVVARGIVHHQNQVLMPVLLKQMFNKGNEGVAVFAAAVV